MIATIWERLSAYVVDTFVVGLAGLVFVFTGASLLAAVVVLNDVVLVAATGASVGKLLLRLRILRHHGGRRIDLGRAIVRWAAKGGALGVLVLLTGLSLGWAALLWPLVDVVPFLYRPDRRAVHDLAAGTLVVRAARLHA